MVVPDRELVERARRGDGAAIGELFSRDWRAARAAAFGVTGGAMPQANEWTLDVGVAARQLLTFPAIDRNCLRDPAARVRRGPSGSFSSRFTRSVADRERRQCTDDLATAPGQSDSDSFRDGLATARISDVLDFSWLVAEPLELRSVQELLEQLATAVVPGVRMRVTHDDEPRYRAALRLHLDPWGLTSCGRGCARRVAGSGPRVNAAHLRFFLEPWATVLSGQVVEFDRLPALPR
jgi:hypothetical protein